MEQLKSINALEPFVLLSKSANSPRGAADLIVQATSSPNTYVFADLLQTPNIQALRNSKEHAPYLTLLEIFAWGNIADYEDSLDLPDISASQRLKLQQLSLLALASVQSPLPYMVLAAALSLPNESALESLITSAIAKSLIAGTLDPHAKLVYVDSVAPLRDLAPGSIPKLTASVDAWRARCSSVLDKLAEEEAMILAAAQDRAEKQHRVDNMYEKRMREANEEERATRGKRVLDDKDAVAVDEDAMDVDGDGGRLKGAKRALMGLGKMMT